MTKPQDALLDEFRAYYMADELPSLIRDGLDAWADESASRLVHDLGGDALQVAALLREAIADRGSSLVQALEDASVYGWTDTDDDWTIFKHIARRIADGIDARIG